MISIAEHEDSKRKKREDKRRKQERDEARRLYEAVDAVIARYSGDVDIGPTFVAIEACKLLDGFKLSKNSSFYVGTNLYCRQIARSRCRNRWETDDTESSGNEGQHSLFPNLQERYPIDHGEGEEPLYRLLEHLTDADYEYNLRRMSADIETRQRRYNALAAHYKEVKNHRGAA